MYAITLWQPWASLLMLNLKRHETRSWLPPQRMIGERSAIHAAARQVPLKLVSEELHEICMEEWGCGYQHTLQRGVVLGTALLKSVASTEALVDDVTPYDLAAGDWSESRYGWEFVDHERYPLPIPARGFQRIWHFTPPAIRAAA